MEERKERKEKENPQRRNTVGRELTRAVLPQEKQRVGVLHWALQTLGSASERQAARTFGLENQQG